MKHAVIVGHPNPQSFTCNVARAYADAISAKGGRIVLRDLCAMNFDPRMRVDELPGSARFAPEPDVMAEREFIGDADVFVFVYPLWFNGPPAMVKGYMERVFGMGFGYGERRGGANPPLLSGRKLLSFTSSGAPSQWLQRQDSWEAIRILFDRHFAAVCGLTELEHIHFGGIHPGMAAPAVESALDRVRGAVERLF